MPANGIIQMRQISFVNILGRDGPSPIPSMTQITGRVSLPRSSLGLLRSYAARPVKTMTLKMIPRASEHSSMLLRERTVAGLSTGLVHSSRVSGRN